MSQSIVILEQQQAIREEYRKQAQSWGNFEIDDDLRWVVEQIPLSRSHNVLDVAAGTGLFGRALAHAVSSVTAVDITPEMIEQGRKKATGRRYRQSAMATWIGRSAALCR